MKNWRDVIWKGRRESIGKIRVGRESDDNKNETKGKGKKGSRKRRGQVEKIGVGKSGQVRLRESESVIGR